MPVHVDASDYQATAAKLKQAPKKVRLAYSKRLRAATRPALEVVLEEGSKEMPQRGGLAEHIATRARISISQAGWGINASLPVKGVTLNRIDATGIVRHPLYGLRKHRWYTTRTPVRAYDRVFDTHADKIRDEVAKAYDDVAASL